VTFHLDKCACSRIKPREGENLLRLFGKVRNECAANREIIVPDDLWETYQEFCCNEPDEAYHTPYFYNAFKHGYLSRLTEPIHRHCLEIDKPHPRLRKQYRKDLAERWLTKDTTKDQFKHARRFKGRLVELMFASWLNEAGWTLLNMEAYDDRAHDVDARSNNGVEYSFEVKDIGQDEMDHDLLVKALCSSGVSVESEPVTSPMNYLLFRVFEAARQLACSSRHKVVVAVLFDFEHRFGCPLKEGWIDWRNPSFLRRDSAIDDFLEEKYKKIPNLDEEVRRYVSGIDQIWIFDSDEPFVLRKQKELEVRRNEQV
jgi:hypothetical protein